MDTRGEDGEDVEDDSTGEEKAHYLTVEYVLALWPHLILKLLSQSLQTSNAPRKPE